MVTCSYLVELPDFLPHSDSFEKMEAGRGLSYVQQTILSPKLYQLDCYWLSDNHPSQLDVCCGSSHTVS